MKTCGHDDADCDCKQGEGMDEAIGGAMTRSAMTGMRKPQVPSMQRKADLMHLAIATAEGLADKVRPGEYRIFSCYLDSLMDR